MTLIEGKKYYTEFCRAVMHAKKEILICMYNFEVLARGERNAARGIMEILENARKRGVHVRALVNDDFTRQQLQNKNWQVRRPSGQKLVHAKLVIVDDAFALVGSHNLTQNAMTCNLELSVKFTAVADVKKLKEKFNEWWLKWI